MGHADGTLARLCTAPIRSVVRSVSWCSVPTRCLPPSLQGEETFADAKLMTDEQLEGKLRFHASEVKRLEGEAEARKVTPSKEQAE